MISNLIIKYNFLLFKILNWNLRVSQIPGF
jgi:hypothetical protein